MFRISIFRIWPELDLPDLFMENPGGISGFFYNSFKILCKEMYSEKNEENSFINIPSSLPVS